MFPIFNTSVGSSYVPTPGVFNIWNRLFLSFGTKTNKNILNSK